MKIKIRRIYILQKETYNEEIKEEEKHQKKNTDYIYFFQKEVGEEEFEEG